MFDKDDVKVNLEEMRVSEQLRRGEPLIVEDITAYLWPSPRTGLIHACALGCLLALRGYRDSVQVSEAAEAKLGKRATDTQEEIAVILGLPQELIRRIGDMHCYKIPIAEIANILEKEGL